MNGYSRARSTEKISNADLLKAVIRSGSAMKMDFIARSRTHAHADQRTRRDPLAA